MVLVLLGGFVIGFFTGHVHQVRSLGQDPMPIHQMKELDRLECLRRARTPGDMEDCRDGNN